MCQAGATPGYNDHNPLQKKCCPIDYSCGPTYSSPCVRNSSSGDGGRVFTNPQYLYRSLVFPGCNDAKNLLTPAAVGGVVAIGILTFTVLCALLLYTVRRKLYSDPQRRRGRAFSGAGAGDVVKQQNGITVTREIKIEGAGGQDVEQADVEQNARGQKTAQVAEDEDAKVRREETDEEEELEMQWLGMDQSKISGGTSALSMQRW